MAYRKIYVLDTEFYEKGPGDNITPVCLCAYDMVGGECISLWQDQLSVCPFDTSDDCLFVSFFGSAEWRFFLACGWPMPRRVVDLFVEHRLLLNGHRSLGGFSLIGALQSFGLSSNAPVEKDRLRKLIMGGGPFSDSERAEILAYCMEDVRATAVLLEAMESSIAQNPLRFGQALARGRYSVAVAKMESVGIPVDVELFEAIKARWEDIKLSLIDAVDGDYCVYQDGHFREASFRELVQRRGYNWPQLDSGKYALDAKTMREMAETYPELNALRQLRATLGEMRLADLAVGPDGRNRTLLSPFKTKTGRNAPSSSKFIFGPAVWLRHLIAPGPGRAVAYVDFKSQEIGIAAALSNDRALMDAVRSGDIYLFFACLAGLAPKGATKHSHGAVRDVMKVLVLAQSYGMTANTLAKRLRRSVPEAEHLLFLFDECFPDFARWRGETLDRSLLGIPPSTVFGWSMCPDGEKPTTLKNFPVQAAGAEMLRLACCLATERGLMVCAPIHDALLIEAGIDQIEDHVDQLKSCMREASRIVLGNFELGSDATIVRYPGRYRDARGDAMFSLITGFLEAA